MRKTVMLMATSALFLAGYAHAERGVDGKTLYETTCTVCHSLGVAGAPQFGDAVAWSKRLNERGLDGLRDHALKGFNSMPAKGTCADCSDKEIFDAIDYMIKNSVKN